MKIFQKVYQRIQQLLKEFSSRNVHEKKQSGLLQWRYTVHRKVVSTLRKWYYVEEKIQGDTAFSNNSASIGGAIQGLQANVDLKGSVY